MAADSRLVIGVGPLQVKEDGVAKLFRLDRMWAVGFSANTDLAWTMVEHIKDELGKKDILNCPGGTCEAVRAAAHSEYEAWFPEVKPAERPWLQIILAGCNEAGPAIYTFNNEQSFAPAVCPDGKGYVGLYHYARYLSQKLYRPDDSTEPLRTWLA